MVGREESAEYLNPSKKIREAHEVPRRPFFSSHPDSLAAFFLEPGDTQRRRRLRHSAALLGGVFIEFSFSEIMLGEEMDDEMEDVFQKSFQYLEIDLEYEFDASRFVDFTQPESLAEARGAELWFETAASYPPSRKRGKELFPAVKGLGI